MPSRLYCIFLGAWSKQCGPCLPVSGGQEGPAGPAGGAGQGEDGGWPDGQPAGPGQQPDGRFQGC